MLTQAQRQLASLEVLEGLVSEMYGDVSRSALRPRWQHMRHQITVDPADHAEIHVRDLEHRPRLSWQRLRRRGVINRHCDQNTCSEG